MIRILEEENAVIRLFFSVLFSLLVAPILKVKTLIAVLWAQEMGKLGLFDENIPCFISLMRWSENFTGPRMLQRFSRWKEHWELPPWNCERQFPWASNLAFPSFCKHNFFSNLQLAIEFGTLVLRADNNQHDEILSSKESVTSFYFYLDSENFNNGDTLGLILRDLIYFDVNVNRVERRCDDRSKIFMVLKNSNSGPRSFEPKKWENGLFNQNIHSFICLKRKCGNFTEPWMFQRFSR